MPSSSLLARSMPIPYELLTRVGLSQTMPFAASRLADLLVALLRRVLLGVLVDVAQRRPGVLPADVDLPAFERLAQHGGAHADALVGLEAVGREQLARDLGDELLLGEALAADDDRLRGNLRLR